MNFFIGKEKKEIKTLEARKIKRGGNVIANESFLLNAD